MPVWTLKLVYNFLASIPVSYHWLRLPGVIHRPQTFSTFVFAPNVHKLSRYLYLLLNHLQQQSVVLASSETVSVLTFTQYLFMTSISHNEYNVHFLTLEI